MLARIISAIVIVVMTAAVAVAQQRSRRAGPQPLDEGTSVIAGTVVDAQSRQPVSGVEITLSMFVGGISRGGVITTDAEGRYSFANIGDGFYMMTARKQDYLNACYLNPEAASPCGSVIVLRDQKRLDINFALIKPATARGRVVDQAGMPIGGATVRMGSPAAPRNEIARAILFSSASAETAKDGTFELHGVPPGEWNLELELKPHAGSIGLPVFFYPGVIRDDEATRVAFSAGRITDNLIFTVAGVAENTLTVRVSSGVVPIADVKASLLKPVPFVSRPIPLNDEGIGEIKGLLESRYFIAARGWINDKAWAAFDLVDFVPPSLDLSLQLMPAGRIKGTIVGRNGTVPPLAGVVVAAPWVHDDVEVNPVTPDESPVSADGSFQVEGVFGRRALRVIGLDASWDVVSVMLGRAEITSVDVPSDATVEVRIVVSRR